MSYNLLSFSETGLSGSFEIFKYTNKMFTKNISLTEKIEAHLNSSSDENGEDDSFDASGKDDFENPSIDELKNKIARYNYHINRI